MAETKLLVTGNLRAWHRVINCCTMDGFEIDAELTADFQTDAEMQQVMELVCNELHSIAYTIFPKA